MENGSVLHYLPSPSRKINKSSTALGEGIAWITVIRYKQPSSKGCTALLTWCLT